MRKLRIKRMSVMRDGIGLPPREGNINSGMEPCGGVEWPHMKLNVKSATKKRLWGKPVSRSLVHLECYFASWSRKYTVHLILREKAGWHRWFCSEWKGVRNITIRPAAFTIHWSVIRRDTGNRSPVISQVYSCEVLPWGKADRNGARDAVVW